MTFVILGIVDRRRSRSEWSLHLLHPPPSLLPPSSSLLLPPSPASAWRFFFDFESYPLPSPSNPSFSSVTFLQDPSQQLLIFISSFSSLIRNLLPFSPPPSLFLLPPPLRLSIRRLMGFHRILRTRICGNVMETSPPPRILTDSNDLPLVIDGSH